MFFKIKNKLVKIDKVFQFEFDVLPETKKFYCKIVFHDLSTLMVWEQEAIDLAMRFGPHVLEGYPEFKFAKNAWAFHNLIAHPLMQILAFFGLTKLGLRVHDATIPRPKMDN